MATVALISLGCPKNLVDAESLLALLGEAGHTVTPYENEAEVILVNTCGFIADAKQESIEAVLEAARYKEEGKLKALIVTGCLAERYRDEITAEIPEVDAVVGLGSNADIVAIVEKILSGVKENFYGEKTDLPLNLPRMQSTPFYTAYLKIAEGCDNRCTYCAIPDIRGRFRSRPMEQVIAEAEALAEGGVKELIVVAQDTTKYGEDLYGAPRLADLLTALCQIEGLRWIRTLYTYPDRLSEEVIETVAREQKLVPYFDIPIQHCAGDLLRRMNRRGDANSLKALMKKIRETVPDVTLRTTLITGFPGETEEQFEELCDFVADTRFDRLGCFAYSAEEGTPAAAFPDAVPEQVRADRAGIIMEEQSRIAEELNRAKIGRTVTVLVEGYDDYIKCFFGRTEADAPEIDGKIFFTAENPPAVGDFVTVRVTDILEYDLLGEEIQP